MSLPKVLEPGIRCAKFDLDLDEVDWPERIFQVLAAIALPVTVFVRGMDITTTYFGLSAGMDEVNIPSSFALDFGGFGGLILLHIAMTLLHIIGIWWLYGIATKNEKKIRLTLLGATTLAATVVWVHGIMIVTKNLKLLL